MLRQSLVDQGAALINYHAIEILTSYLLLRQYDNNYLIRPNKNTDMKRTDDCYRGLGDLLISLPLNNYIG